jgi:TPR repeat protein
MTLEDSSVPEPPPGFVFDDSESNSDGVSAEKDGSPEKWMPRSAVAVGDLFGSFSAEPTPDPNEYSQLRVSAEQGDPNAQYRLALYQYRIGKDAGAMVEWLRKAATQNHVKAQTALGNCHRFGVGVPKDANEAVSWYRRAAEQGYVEAQCNLFVMYHDGDGVPKDLNEAIKWLKRAAHQSLPDEQYDLAKMFQNGDGIIPQDSNEAVYWYTKAAEQGHAEAQFQLGWMYHKGDTIKKDREKAVKWLTRAAEQKHPLAIMAFSLYPESADWFSRAAEQGSVEAQYRLGSMYHDGDGVPHDYKEALKWWTKAAEQGDRAAQMAIALMYHTGDGVPQDYTEAAKWWTKAAQAGDLQAQHRLGLMYLDGRGVQQDVNEALAWLTKAAGMGAVESQILLALTYSGRDNGIPANHAEAAKWFEKAASSPLWPYIEDRVEWFHRDRRLPPPTLQPIQDNAETAYLVAILYYVGWPGPRDLTEAAKWFAKAADQGLAQAQFALGLMHSEGDGVPHDDALAAKWYAKAGEQGLAEAQSRLGAMYARGVGVSQDRAEGVKWFTKAAEQGHANAQVALGFSYFFGDGASQDRTEAVKWFTKAAEQGNLNAQVYLGRVYFNGDGIPQDYVEAARWMTKAAQQGHAQTQFLVGVAHIGGIGVPQSDEEGAKWLTRAAQQGHVEAAYHLARLYHNGQGVPKDLEQATRWYTKAAEQGHVEAQASLASTYFSGNKDVPPDYAKAAEWFAKAAEQGHAMAQLGLALQYRSGQGVLEDYSEAYKWVILALTKGMDEPLGFKDSNELTAAQDMKEALRGELTPTQIEEGQRRARAFLAERERRSNEDQQRLAKVTTSASGFLITPNGYILTARHAVEKAARVEVIHRGKTYPAKLVLQDESTDVAVLKVEGGDLTCLPLVSSVAMKPGDAVFTMGFPQVTVQGTEAKFTEGSISALSGLGGSPRSFQISVPVQPGNSGGPLVNEKGEVVGLVVSRLDDVTSLLATGSVPQTVNYALKSSFILPLVESIPDLPEKLPKGSAPKDRSAAIEKARQAVVLIVGYNDAPNSKDSP